MRCKGHFGNKDCWLPPNPKSFWGLCQSCTRIENRLFLEAVQNAIRKNETVFTFHEKEYSLDDVKFPKKYLRFTVFTPSHQDPRLSLLSLTCSKRPQLGKAICEAFIKDSSFLLSASLLYRNHLPQKHTCSMLQQIQRSAKQHFLDLPCCPCCMSKNLSKLKAANLTYHQINHINSIFGNRMLAQHPTWFVHIFGLLQTIWENDMEEIFNFGVLSRYIEQENPIQLQIDLRDWLVTFLETPIVIEKILTKRISEANMAYLVEKTAQNFDLGFLKRVVRSKHYVYRRELIEKTWHPDRVIQWCFDLEDMQDLVT